MPSLISKDETIKGSPIYIGYLILVELKKQKEGKISIFELIEKLKSKQSLLHYRQILFSLILLYSTEIIEFQVPYIYKRNND